MPKLLRPALISIAALALAQVASGVSTITAACKPISDAAIVVDGKLNDAGWKGLDTLFLLENNNPTGGKPGSVTKVLTAWSRTRLYAAFIVYTRNVKATITKHDGALYNEDVVEMFLDPDGDSKDYLELEWNCLNTSLDFHFTGVRTGEDPGWTATGMKNSVTVQGTANSAADVDTSWTLEVSVPWDAIKQFSKSPLPPKAGDNLPLNFYRIDHPTKTVEELMAWSPTGVADFHRPDKFGQLIFSDAMSATAGGNLQVSSCARGFGPASGGAFAASAASMSSFPVVSADGRAHRNTQVTLLPSGRFWSPEALPGCPENPALQILR